MPPFNLSNTFLCSEVLFLSYLTHRWSTLHQEAEMNRTEWGQAQLGLAEKQMEIAHQQKELAQKQTESTKPKVDSTMKQINSPTTLELAQAQMVLAQAQTQIAHEQMPLRDQLGSSLLRISDTPFPQHMFTEKYNVLSGSHRNHDPQAKVRLECERVFRFPGGDFGDGLCSFLISSTLRGKFVLSASEV